MPSYTTLARRCALAVAATVAFAFPLTVGTSAVAGPKYDSSCACPKDGYVPGLGTPSTNKIFKDTNVNVFVGDDYETTASESEGLLVVLDDATISSSLFNVGTAGGGSLIVPENNAVMLAVGDELDIRSNLHIGLGFASQGITGGSAKVGGTISGRYDAGTGTVRQNLGSRATAQWKNFPKTITRESKKLSKRATNTRHELSYNRLTIPFTYKGSTSVVSIPASKINKARGLEIDFVGNARTADPIVINVQDDTNGKFSLDLTSFLNDGNVVDLRAEAFGNISSRVLWNLDSSFHDVTIGGAGKAGYQVPGSWLVPSYKADVSLNSSTNGRVWVNGDLTVHKQGNEQHSYPWIGEEPFDCVDKPKPEPKPEPTEPTEPSEPEPKPEPTEPSEPGEPTEPVQPEPTEPTDPSEPGEPTEPTDPSEPTEPSEPGESTDEPTEPGTDSGTLPTQEPQPTPTVEVLGETIEKNPEATDFPNAEGSKSDNELAQTGANPLFIALGAACLALIGIGGAFIARARRQS
ncbi:choice-of-anchor A family protein [Timonella sp. A28]|uniref:choice-of-anchor A family protein n=1 Tax=Timonella sp. A28 TaxID=3442640 RepID=UPI003EBB1FFF